MLLRDGVRIKGRVGTWYVIGESVYNYKAAYLLESEVYGDEAACLIVDKDLNIICSNVWNGFDELDY